MKNDYLEYYGEYHISPVKQNIDDIEIHYERRKKLYRQCGIPTITFRNAEMLEIGPGGGYNTLAFFNWDCKHIDLVEPNPAGIEDIESLFAKQAIPCDRYKIYPCKIEDLQTDKKYDIIIAEGFLHHLSNQQMIISKLQNLIAENGIIVITCTDHVCYFIEIMKRLIGQVQAYNANMTEYNQKVEYLADLFAPQLSKLQGVSRSPKEWVQDQILCPAITNGTELTMLQAIDYLGEDFDILGCSPRMFTDYSWYKDIYYDYKKEFREQFARKRLTLLQANMVETEVSIEHADKVVKYFENIKQLASDYEKEFNIEKISAIVQEMDAMDILLRQNLNDGFINIFYEIKEILLDVIAGKSINMEKYPEFFSAFGRTLQYMSFVKK